jgi:hypothetical protein
MDARNFPNADHRSLSGRTAIAALERESTLEFLVVEVDSATAVWAYDPLTATELLAKPSNLLLEIIRAARAGDF